MRTLSIILGHLIVAKYIYVTEQRDRDINFIFLIIW